MTIFSDQPPLGLFIRKEKNKVILKQEKKNFCKKSLTVSKEQDTNTLLTINANSPHKGNPL